MTTFVSISPVDKSRPEGVSREKCFDVLEETKGSLPDFQVPPEAVIDPIPPLDVDE